LIQTQLFMWLAIGAVTYLFAAQNVAVAIGYVVVMVGMTAWLLVRVRRRGG